MRDATDRDAVPHTTLLAKAMTQAGLGGPMSYLQDYRLARAMDISQLGTSRRMEEN